MTILDNNEISIYAVATTAGKNVTYPAKSYLFQTNAAIENWSDPGVQILFQDNSYITISENPVDEYGTTVKLSQVKKLDF